MSGEDAETNQLSFLDDPRILIHVFYPRREERHNPEKAEVSSERSVGAAVSFKVDENINIEGQSYLSGSSASSAPNLLLFHGNGETAYDYDDIGPVYADSGINFFVVDYRGYGTSGGSPTFSGMLKDAVKIFQDFALLLKDKGLSGNVFIMGRSLGSAPALEVALKFPDKVSGLIIESGFAHTYNLLTTLGVDPLLLDPEKERLVSNLEKMKKASMPVLVIHGELDEIIPPSDGLDLYKAAGTDDKELLLIPGAGHNTLLLYGLKEYLRAISGFVHRLN